MTCRNSDCTSSSPVSRWGLWGAAAAASATGLLAWAKSREEPLSAASEPGKELKLCQTMLRRKANISGQLHVRSVRSFGGKAYCPEFGDSNFEYSVNCPNYEPVATHASPSELLTKWAREGFSSPSYHSLITPVSPEVPFFRQRRLRWSFPPVPRRPGQ